MAEKLHRHTRACQIEARQGTTPARPPPILSGGHRFDGLGSSDAALRPPPDHQCGDEAGHQQAVILRDGEGERRGEADDRPQCGDHQQVEREPPVGPQEEPQGEDRRRARQMISTAPAMP
jgi:hypothetical protein